MATGGAASLHVGVGSIINVAAGFCSAIGTAMGTISMRPAIFEWLPAAAASSTGVASIIAASMAAASSLVCTSGASARVLVVVDLGLESGDGGC